MKKLTIILFILISIFSLSACSSGETKSSDPIPESQSNQLETKSNLLPTDPTTEIETTLAPSIEESLEKSTTVSESINESVAQEDVTSKAEAETNPIDDLKFNVRSAISKSTSRIDVSINDITINENLGTDDENDFVVLAYLSFDVKNTAQTTKKMLNLLNNEIGTNMAKIDNISELTIFWEVPYLNQSQDNIAKANLLRNDEGLYFEEEWYDSSIFE